MVECHLADLIVGLCLIGREGDGALELSFCGVGLLRHLQNPAQTIVGGRIVRAGLEVCAHIAFRRRHVLQIHLDARFGIERLRVLRMDQPRFMNVAVRIAKQAKLILEDAQVQQERKAVRSLSLCREKRGKSTIPIAAGTLFQSSSLRRGDQHVAKLAIGAIMLESLRDVWAGFGWTMLIQQ